MNRRRHYNNTELKLKKSEFRFRSIAQTINGIVREVDLNTFKNIYVCPQSMNIVGFPSSDWTGNRYFWVEQIHPEDRKTVLAKITKAIKAGGHHTIEYRMINSDGDMIWARDLLSIRGQNKSISG